MERRFHLRSWKFIVTAALAMVCWMSMAGYAQQTPYDELRGIYKLSLDDLSKDIAEEYLDILENLQDVLEDYSDYMENLEEEGSDHRIDFIRTMLQNLRKGNYTGDPERLLDDLYDAVDEIKATERRHRVKYDTNRPKCCRLSRSLRKELIVIAELVEDYTDQHATQILGNEDIKKYIQATLQFLERVGEMDELEYLEALESEELAEMIESLKKLGLEDRIRISIEDHVMPELPEMPEPPVVAHRPGRGYKVGTKHESQGRVQVTNSSWPISVVNPLGDISITGSGDDYITASLVLEVSSSSHDKEKKYLNRATLAVGQDGSHYFVEVDLPRITDHRTELLGSVLEISVPESNRIECNGEFGRITVSAIEAEVSIDAENARIQLEDITGNVVVDNSSGPVEVTGVYGEIEIETSYAPIMVTECEGTMRLENEYNSITVIDCDGSLEIVNTGQIEIANHVGYLEIDNSYGTVEVDGNEGPVRIKNGYQSIIITDITGSVELENEYGEISAEGIDGSLSAVTSNAPIFVESLEGPVDLSNYFGSINVVLDQGFRGGSTITSTDGTVKIAFIEEPDLILFIHTTGGSISSSLPISVRTRGDSKSAELVLGDGGESLDLSGTNTAIIIQGR